MSDTLINSNSSNPTGSLPSYRTDPFSGTPKRYLKLAFLLGFGSHILIYSGLFVVEYLWHSRDWIIGWKMLLVAFLSAAFLTRHCYQSILGLDARRGKGSRWKLVKTTVTLPEHK